MDRDSNIKNVIEKLDGFYESLSKGERMKFDISYLRKANVYLADLKKENETLVKQLCEKEDMIREAEGRIQELEIQIGSQKSRAQGSWIMAEDAPPKDLGYYLVTTLDLDTYKYSTMIAKWHGNMFITQDEPIGKNEVVIAWLPKSANPAPLVPTFKDIFLKRFPKAPIDEDGIPKACIAVVFPWAKHKHCDGWMCFEDWNQPYFEPEEGEAE